MSIITSFNTGDNFWVLNPQFQSINPFKRLYDSDKSRNKSTSSKKMWFIVQAMDDSPNNVFRNLLFEEKVNKLSEDFMLDPNYYTDNEQDLQQYMETYDKFHTTAARRALEEWKEKIIDRSGFIKRTPYTMDSFTQDEDTGKFVKTAGTAKMLDDMMKNSNQIYALYHTILKDLTKEDEDSKIKGGQKLSLSDEGVI